MKKLILVLLTLATVLPSIVQGAISNDDKYRMNRSMGTVARKVGLGDIIQGLQLGTQLGTAAVTNTKVDPQVVQYVDKTLSSAQVLALNTTPITLVAAPGAGLVNFVRAVYATMTYGTATYSCNAAGLTVRYTDGSGATAATLTQGFCQSSASAMQYVPASTTAITPVANAPIVLYAGVANPTTGDSPVKVRVYYTQAPNPLP